MRKMREIDGYMTLEASLIIPVLCFLLVLLFSFFFYHIGKLFVRVPWFACGLWIEGDMNIASS